MSSNTPAVVVDDFEFDLDLDAGRTAAAEANKHQPGVKIGGHRLPLPVELPLDVLQPLVGLNVDVSVLVRQALDARASGSNEDVLSAVVDMLVYNPALPREVVEAVTTMARRLFGEEGYAALCEGRPTLPEIGKLAKYLGRRYGVSLGEASQPSESSEGTGTTSSATSSGSTDSTSAKSGAGRAGRRKAS